MFWIISRAFNARLGSVGTFVMFIKRTSPNINVQVQPLESFWKKVFAWCKKGYFQLYIYKNPLKEYKEHAIVLVSVLLNSTLTKGNMHQVNSKNIDCETDQNL